MDVDAYLAKLVGPSFKLTHKSFEMDDMTVAFDETTQCYKIPVTGSVGIFRATVTRLFKKDGLLHVTVGYIPTQSSDDSILNNLSDTPTKYMDYLFSRQSGSWYLTGLTDSETKPESADSAASAAEPAPLAESEVNDAILPPQAILPPPAPLLRRLPRWKRRRRAPRLRAPRLPLRARRHNRKPKSDRTPLHGMCEAFHAGVFLFPDYFRSNLTTTSRYHR